MWALLRFGTFACGRDSATVTSCGRGRERPHGLFGRLKAGKVGSLPPVLVVFRTLLFGFRFNIAPSFSGVGADRVKTLVQDEVQSKNVTFFTARGISGEKSWDCLGRTDGRRQANLRRQRST
jgi:hypothetical protein